MEAFLRLVEGTGFTHLDWRMLVMWGVALTLLYLAVFKNFEPLLLVPIGFGALLANLPTEGLVNKPAGTLHSPVSGMVVQIGVEEGDLARLPFVERELPLTVEGLYVAEGSDAQATLTELQEAGNVLIAVVRPSNLLSAEGGADTSVLLPGDQLVWADATGDVIAVSVAPGDTIVRGGELVQVHSTHVGGLFHYIQMGVLLEIFPPLIFLGIGALTDFGPLIANPRTLLLGAAAQFGVFATYLGAVALGFSQGQSAAIGIIGGADGPTSIFLANALAPELLAPIAVAAYSYMALVPVIQPPIMRLCTTQAERKIRMKSLRKVGQLEKLIFSLSVTVFCILLIPAAAPLIGMLMLGNFLRECKVTDRLSKAAQNELINIVTIFLGTSVGITMTGDRFIRLETIGILFLGVLAFMVATASGVLMAKLMNVVSKNKINPLIGSAGVSAVPMAARVSQVEGQKSDPKNFLLMHAMGPNVAGVIGTALCAGYFLSVLGGH